MPNRILKETICSSESIRNLSWFEEVFFYRLIVNADDYGRLDGRTEILQARLFPLRRDITEATISKALNALTTAGMVCPYTVEQKPFLQLTAWEQHQQIRAKKSKYPHPQESDINGNQLISNVPVIQSNPILSESTAREDAPPSKKKFIPPTEEEVSAYCKERANAVNAGNFVAFYESKGWMVGKNKMKDWKAAVRTWEQRDGAAKGTSEPKDNAYEYFK
jgi:hypothetical protein